MRFRYFDADGNEVSLSTTRALAARIKLGDITDTTLLYDAATDEWAPACEQGIYRHIVAHGAPTSGEEPAEEPGEGTASANEEADPVPDPSPRSRRRSRKSSAPPLEDFWGPALAASGSSDQPDPTEAFDLSLEELDREASAAGSAPVDPELPPLRAEEPHRPSGGEAPDSPEVAPDGDEPDGGERPAATPSRDPRGPEAAGRPSSTPGTGKSRAGSAARAGGRKRDPSLARLEAMAREAAKSMERKEALRGRRVPTLSERATEAARRGSLKAGEALRSGADASARAISEGGRAAAHVVGSGARAVKKTSRGVVARLGRLLDGGIAGAGGSLRSGAGAVARLAGSAAGMVRAMGKELGRGGGVAASAGTGAVAGLVGLLGTAAGAVRAAIVAAVRWAVGGWRLLGSAGRVAGRGVGRAARAAIREVRPALNSSPVFGTIVFAAAFLYFTHGAGRETGEEVWRATVGIARSVAAETGQAGPGTVTETRQPASGPVADAGTEASPPPEVPVDAPVPAASEPTGPPRADISARDMDLALASEAAVGDMIAAMDSVEQSSRLPDAPPEEWLGGYYLSHASEFREVRSYWARYRSYIRTVKAEDIVYYREALEARLREREVSREELLELVDRGMRRFRASRLRRDSLYDAMAAVAEAAVDLHDFLVAHESRIDYDPVRSGRLSRAPVLEAYPTTPEVEAGMDAHLDRLLQRMERVQELKPVSTRDLQNLLFDNLQAVEAVDTFRVGPFDTTVDTGGSPGEG